MPKNTLKSNTNMIAIRRKYCDLALKREQYNRKKTYIHRCVFSYKSNTIEKGSNLLVASFTQYR